MQASYENPTQAFYCRDTDHATKTLGFRPHLHYEIELAVVWSGHTKVSIDSLEYDVYGGDIVISFPNQIHAFQTMERESYILLKFNPDLMPDLLRLLTSTIPVSNVLKGGAKDEELAQLIRKISHVYYGDELYKEPILHGYLLAFFGKLLQKLELRDVQSGDYRAVGMILNYCNSNFDKELSLSVLEKELHLNKYYISHIMSNKLNIGFNDYINSIRISNACKLLVKSDLTVTEICEAVGFNTLRTFNRAFSKQMECTPSEYRRKKRVANSDSKIVSN